MAVSNKTFAVGEQYHHFLVDGKAYQAGQYDYEIDSNGIVKIWNVVGSNEQRPIINQHWSTLIDAATSAAFASQAAFVTWLRANFFF